MKNFKELMRLLLEKNRFRVGTGRRNRLKANSKPGKGSEFVFTLPKADV
jgi:hypothetical protein